jgi:hypothetical protein
MHIDLHHNAGEITSFAQKRKENEDGETTAVRVDLGLLVQAKPDFLDEYLEGHNTGAQPSMVFWRMTPGDERSYPRYLGLGKIQLAVSGDPQYTLKLREKRGDTAEEALLPPPIEVLLSEVEVRKLHVTIGANGCAVALGLRFHPRVEFMPLLSRLMLLEEIEVNVHNTNPDMFASPAPLKIETDDSDDEPAPTGELE